MDAKKFDKGKPDLSLLPRHSLEQVALVLMMGANKYGRYNWAGGMKWSRMVGAAMRHIVAFNDGENTDPESGISHLAHAVCGLIFLLEYQHNNLGEDDRYVRDNNPGSASGPSFSFFTTSCVSGGVELQDGHNAKRRARDELRSLSDQKGDGTDDDSNPCGAV